MLIRDEKDGAPSRLRRPVLSLQGVPSVNVVLWLAIFAGYEWLRAKFGTRGIPLDVSYFTQKISALEFIEIFFIARMLGLSGTQDRLGIIEAIAISAGVAVGLVLFDKPFVFASILSIFLLFRFVWTRHHRAVVIALFIFLMQYNPILANGSALFHTMIAEIDAYVLNKVLHLAGHNVTKIGSIISNPFGDFSIDVQKACASSYPLIEVLPGFGITLLGLRGYFIKSDLVYFFCVVGATFSANLTRLYPMALSYEGWLYWHEGEGKAVAAAIYAVIAFAGGYLAFNHSKNPVLA